MSQYLVNSICMHFVVCVCITDIVKCFKYTQRMQFIEETVH